jgi:hypothetical protein
MLSSLCSASCLPSEGKQAIDEAYSYDAAIFLLGGGSVFAARAVVQRIEE